MKLRIGFLSRLKLWQKFLLLGAIVVPLAGAPTYLFLSEIQADIELAKEEVEGLAPAGQTVKVIQLVQQHRGLSAAFLGGNNTVADALQANEAEVVQALAALAQHVKGASNDTLIAAWDKAEAHWIAMARETDAREADTRKSFTDHTNLVAEYLNILDFSLDHWKLSLDPDAQTYHLIQATLNDLPRATEPFSRMQVFGGEWLADAARLRAHPEPGKVAVTAADRVTMSGLAEDGREKSQLGTKLMAKAFKEAPKIQERIGDKFKVPEDSSNRMMALATKEIVASESHNFDAPEYVRLFTVGLDEQFKFISFVVPVVRDELIGKIDGLRNRQYTLSGALAGLLALVLLFATLITRNITGTVHDLQRSVEGVRQGDFNALQAIDAKDEIGDLGRTVNSLLQDRIEAQEKAESAQHEAEKSKSETEESIITMMDELAPISSGDMTRRLSVSEAFTGGIADAVNEVIGSLGRALGKVSAASEKVATGAERNTKVSELLRQASAAQRTQIDNSVKAVSGMTQSIAVINQSAQQAAEVSRQSAAAAQSGEQVVEQNLAAMNTMRQSMQEVLKTVKGLGESSQAIGEIVELISEITDQTQVLAVNASLQAAQAGAAGHGFRVVAGEVQRLAERSGESAKRIGTMIMANQGETQSAIAAVERSTVSLIENASLAERAGRELKNISAITAQINTRVEEISLATESQAKDAGQLQTIMTSLKDESVKAEETILISVRTLEEMQTTIKELDTSVGGFKLAA